MRTEVDVDQVQDFVEARSRIAAALQVSCITSGTCSGPELGKLNRVSTSAAVRSRNSVELERIRSRSMNAARVHAISAGEGFSRGSASRAASVASCWNCPARRRPLPKKLSRPVQSTRLNHHRVEAVAVHRLAAQQLEARVPVGDALAERVSAAAGPAPARARRSTWRAQLDRIQVVERLVVVVLDVIDHFAWRGHVARRLAAAVGDSSSRPPAAVEGLIT